MAVIRIIFENSKGSKQNSYLKPIATIIFRMIRVDMSKTVSDILFTACLLRFVMPHIFCSATRGAFSCTCPIMAILDHNEMNHGRSVLNSLRNGEILN
jgi:hypothetical protein